MHSKCKPDHTLVEMALLFDRKNGVHQNFPFAAEDDAHDLSPSPSKECTN